jgi:hypothetical protein
MGAEKMPESERGEGNYKASKDYDERSEKFVEKNRGKLDDMAREAADSLEGSEGDDLRKAEDEGRSHARK